MPERSPVEILGAILDEVEGLRRTDPRSHLPMPLLREARDVVNAATAPPGLQAQGGRIQYLEDTEGLTIVRAFGNGDTHDGCTLVFQFDNGQFLALSASDDDGEAVPVEVDDSRHARTLADYLSDRAQEEAGLTTRAEREAKEREKRKEGLRSLIADAKRRAADHERMQQKLTAELEALEAKG